MKLALLTLCMAGAFAQAPSSDPWKDIQFWMGEWAGEGAGTPGAGAGGFTFAFELDRKIVVRRNHADYPAEGNRPAFRHEDLMVVYPGPPLRAIYWDNEGHVIHYKVTTGEQTVEFVSDPAEKEPRYRMTYRRTGVNSGTLSFDIAPPGKPDAFQNYINAQLRRK